MIGGKHYSLLHYSLRVSFCRLLPTVSFSVNFGYLFFFRCMYLVGFDPPTGPTNAVQLLLTLKVRMQPFSLVSMCAPPHRAMYTYRALLVINSQLSNCDVRNFQQSVLHNPVLIT